MGAPGHLRSSARWRAAILALVAEARESRRMREAAQAGYMTIEHVSRDELRDRFSGKPTAAARLLGRALAALEHIAARIEQRDDADWCRGDGDVTRGESGESEPGPCGDAVALAKVKAAIAAMRASDDVTRLRAADGEPIE